MKNTGKLITDYEKTVNELTEIFCKKQGFEFYSDFWVAGLVGQIILVSDFYFNFSDILFDLKTKQKKGLIIEWYYYCLDNETTILNYSTYTKTKNK